MLKGRYFCRQCQEAFEAEPGIVGMSGQQQIEILGVPAGSVRARSTQPRDLAKLKSVMLWHCADFEHTSCRLSAAWRPFPPQMILQ